MRTVRVLGVVLALAGCAWFVIGIRQAHDTAAAGAIVSGPLPLTAAQAAHARSLLHTAGQLNPDTQVDLLRAQLDRQRGDGAAARATIRKVLRDEPRNVRAWFALARSEGSDPRMFLLALGHIRALMPRVPPPR